METVVALVVAFFFRRVGDVRVGSVASRARRDAKADPQREARDGRAGYACPFGRSARRLSTPGCHDRPRRGRMPSALSAAAMCL
jgi:hypothetical protein